jgi:hypothetical protein
MRKANTRLPEQGTQTPSPAPDLIPAEPKNQLRTHIAIGTANGALQFHLTRRLRNICHRNKANKFIHLRIRRLRAGVARNQIQYAWYGRY